MEALVVIGLLIWVLVVIGSAVGRASAAGERHRAEQRRNDPGDKIWFDRGGLGPNWRRVTTSAQGIVGEQYRADAVRAFAEGEGRSLQPIREPDNPHDPNAIAIFGLWTEGGQARREQLGYLPRELSAAMAATRPADMPLRALPVSLYTRGEFLDLKIALFEPSVRSGFWPKGEAPAQLSPV